MQIVHVQDARLLEWASKTCAMQFDPQACRWVAGLDAGGVVWVVVYSHFSTMNCSISLATDGSRRWASRAMFREGFRIPFVQWGMRRVTFIVSADNEASLRMHRHKGRFAIGGTEEGRLRNMFGDGIDGIVFGLLKGECKWI